MSCWQEVGGNHPSFDFVEIIKSLIFLQVLVFQYETLGTALPASFEEGLQGFGLLKMLL